MGARATLLAIVVLVGCGDPSVVPAPAPTPPVVEQEPRPAPVLPRPAPPRVEPPPFETVAVPRDVCGDVAEPYLRDRVEVPPCGRPMRALYVRAREDGHDVFIVGWSEPDVRGWCGTGPGPRRPGEAILVDGERTSRLSVARPASEDDRAALLRGAIILAATPHELCFDRQCAEERLARTLPGRERFARALRRRVADAVTAFEVSSWVERPSWSVSIRRFDATTGAEGRPSVEASTLHDRHVVPSAPRPEPEAAARPGTLRLNTQPWSVVYVDDARIGMTPQMSIALAPGPHTVRLVNDELDISETISVDIVAGETVTRVVRLGPGSAHGGGVVPARSPPSGRSRRG